jgi:ribosomal protein L11 methyltransferase
MSFALVMVCPADDLDYLSSLCFDGGALGVETQEPGMLLMPGTPALPEGRGRCIAHFNEKEEAQACADSIADEMPALEIPAPLEIAAEDWSTSWRVHHKPTRIGPRAWVHPPWDVPSIAKGEVAVIIDPGMAFGTGAHATTALCLERVDELMQEIPGADLLDVGTGTGIIAMLAVKLGAGARVCGTENDAVAIDVAKEGAQLNGLAPDRISWQLRSCDDLPAPYDKPFPIVIANILLNTLVELAPQIAGKVAPGGHLVLSGLLAHQGQGEDAQAAYEAQGLKPFARKEREGWLRVELVRA